MNSEDFLKYAILKRNIIVLFKQAIYTPEYRMLKRAKTFTRMIDFKCEFKEDGTCNGGNDRWMDLKNPACCCQRCYDQVGYLDMINENDIWYYAHEFQPKIGFWREGKGCILHREKRSKVCLCYSCKKELNSMDNMQFLMSYFEEKLKEEYIKPIKLKLGIRKCQISQ